MPIFTEMFGFCIVSLVASRLEFYIIMQRNIRAVAHPLKIFQYNKSKKKLIKSEKNQNHTNQLTHSVQSEHPHQTAI